MKRDLPILIFNDRKLVEDRVDLLGAYARLVVQVGARARVDVVAVRAHHQALECGVVQVGPRLCRS